MEIRQLRHFVAVAEKLSFRQAADQLNLTQQAVSKSILQLEAQLGMKLLERSRQSVMLTDHGEQILPYARTILAEVQRLDDVTADITGHKFGQLKVGASPTLIDDIVPSTLGLFHARHPRTRVVLERGDFARLREMMLQGELDIILSTAPDDTQGHLIALETLSSDRNVIVVRAGHPLAADPAISCYSLRDYPFIATHNYRKGEAYLARLFASADAMVPRPILKTGSLTFAISWIMQNDHWWITPRRQVARALRSGTLVSLAVAPADESWPIIMATRRHATRSPAVLAYAQILRTYMQNMDGKVEDAA